MRKRLSRRSLLTLTGATITASLAGCLGEDNIGENDTGNGGNAFPSYEIPRHSEWIPTERHNEDELFFTHLDWEMLNNLDSDADPNEDDETEEVIEEIPILGLPIYGAIITPLTIFGIFSYPFAGDVFPEEGQTVEGVGTSTITWAGDFLVFHGEFDPTVFANQYADGFEETDGQDAFTLYVGTDSYTENQAYAVSEDTLIVGMTPGEEDDYVTEEVVSDALDRYADATNRVVDAEDGQWLFETTGKGQMAFGAWQTEDLLAALDPDDEVTEDVDEQEPDTEPDVEDNPVFDNVESLINSLVFTVEDGEMRDIEARFSGVYPGDAVPSEDEVREHLIGNEDVPHDIVIEGSRVHATATFEKVST